MKVVAPLSGLTLCLAASAAMSRAAAVEPSLAGAWVQGMSCDEVFSRSGEGVSFKKPVNVFASAFIISGSQIRTPQASCRIKAVKRSGERRILNLACATPVALDEAPAILALSADGTLHRYLNAADTTGTRYQRCS
jgi:hypothetical protein